MAPTLEAFTVLIEPVCVFLLEHEWVLLTLGALIWLAFFAAIGTGIYLLVTLWPV